MRQWLWVLVVAVVAATAGYTLGRDADGTGGVNASVDSAAAGDSVVVTRGAVPVGATNALPAGARTLLDSASVDLDLDGETERLELYAAVERDARGRLMWDDGQQWALLVRDGEMIYPLVDERVQLGHLRFWVVERDRSSPPVVVVLRETGSGLHVRPFVYDAARGAFAPAASLEASGNVVHASPAGY